MPTLTFKVSAEEARQIRAKARAEKRSVSALLRASVLPQPKVVEKRHPVSGLLYDAGGAARSFVSHEQIKSLLAGFP
jgi:hypothetical protein